MIYYQKLMILNSIIFLSYYYYSNLQKSNKIYIISEFLKKQMSLPKQHLIKRLSLNIPTDYTKTIPFKCQDHHQTPKIQLKDTPQQNQQEQEQYRKLQKKLRQQFSGVKKNNPQRNSLDQKYFFEKDDTEQQPYSSEDCRQQSFNIINCQNYFREKSFCCNTCQTVQIQHLNSQITDRDIRIKNLEDQIIGLKVQLSLFNQHKENQKSMIKKHQQLQNKYKQLQDNHQTNLKQIQMLKIQNKKMIEHKELNQYLTSKCVSLKAFDASSINGLSCYFQDKSSERDLDEQYKLSPIEQFDRVNSTPQISHNYNQLSQRKAHQKPKLSNAAKINKQMIKQPLKKPFIPKQTVSKIDTKTKSDYESKNAKKTTEIKISINAKNIGDKKAQQKQDISNNKNETLPIEIEIQNLKTQIKQLRKQITSKSSQITQKDGQIQELESNIKEMKQHFTEKMTKKEQQKHEVKKKNIILKQYIKKLTNDNQKVIAFYKKNYMEHFQVFYQEKKQKYQTKLMNIITMLRKHYFDEVRKEKKFQNRKQRSLRLSLQKIIKYINQDYENFDIPQFKDFSFSVEIDAIIRNQILKTQQQIQTVIQEKYQDISTKIHDFQTPQHKQIFRKSPGETLSTLEKSIKRTLQMQQKVIDMKDQQCQVSQSKLLMIVQRNLQLSINLKQSTLKNSSQTQILIEENQFTEHQCQTQPYKVDIGSQSLNSQFLYDNTETQTSNYITERSTQTSNYINERSAQTQSIRNIFKAHYVERQTQISTLMINYSQNTDIFNDKNHIQIQSQKIDVIQNQCQCLYKSSLQINTDFISTVNAQTFMTTKKYNESQTDKIILQSAQIQTENKYCADQCVGTDNYQISKQTQIETIIKFSRQINTDAYQHQISTQIQNNIEKKNVLINTNEYLKTVQTQSSFKLQKAISISINTDQIFQDAYTQVNPKINNLPIQKIDASIQVTPSFFKQSVEINNQSISKETFVQTIQQVICTTKKQVKIKEDCLFGVKDNRICQIPAKSQQKIDQSQKIINNNYQFPRKLSAKQTKYLSVDAQRDSKTKLQRQQKQQQISPIIEINDAISDINSCKTSCILDQESLSKSSFRKTHFQNHEAINRKQNTINFTSMTRNNDKSKQVIVQLTQDEYKNLPIEIVLQKMFKSIPQGFEREDKVQYIDKKFKWKPQKYYYLQTVSDSLHSQKFLLWKKGLLSLNSGKSLRLKPKGLIAQNKDMLILGNSQVIASGNELKVRLKKRNELIGNLQNGTWKILQCQIFIPKMHIQFF